MQISESTLEMLAFWGDLEACEAMATIDVPCSGVRVDGCAFVSGDTETDD